MGDSQARRVVKGMAHTVVAICRHILQCTGEPVRIVIAVTKHCGGSKWKSKVNGTT